MLATRSPHEAYRRVDFDARVAGADPGQLVTLCYEQLISALGTAVYANGLGDNLLKSQSLTRALSAITALHWASAARAAWHRRCASFTKRPAARSSTAR